MTVVDEDLRGVSDQTLFEACCHEGRALITLDRDFGQVLRFPPETSAGIIVLDLGSNPRSSGLQARLRDAISIFESRNPAGELWIVEPGRIRIHLREADE